MQSHGLEMEDDPLAGADGLRRAWLVTAAVPGSFEALTFQIIDGIVSDTSAEPGDPSTPVQRPQLDSPEAVRLAFDARPGFQASSDAKSEGINFVATYDSETGRSVVRVGGSYLDQLAFIDFDSATGDLVKAQFQGYGPSGGVFYSEDGGSTWQASDLSGPVNAIAADPTDIAVAYAVQPNVSAGIGVMRTLDGGATWTETARLPSDAGAWPFDTVAVRLPEGPIELLVGTRTGLWSSNDGGASWAKVDSLPAMPAWRLGTASNGTVTRVFVSLVSSPLNAALYSSTDLSQWRKEAEGGFRLSRSTDGTHVFAVDESQPDEALALGVDWRQPVSLPHSTFGDAASPVMRMAGNLADSSLIVGESPGNIWFSPDGGTTWQMAFEGSFASLAASSDNTTLLAGGFRSAMSRSSDGGQTWTALPAGPTGTIVAIRFLSPDRVIAVAEGGLQWQGF
jgi:photosystem II stability/assembly factor-like uncharacterized protein